MSMEPDKLTLEEKNKFRITSNENNPVLIKFKNFDGESTIASPALLMAMIIKRHIKCIKGEMEKNPNEIGFCILEEFSKEERNRVEEGIKESCKMLEEKYMKINCVFIHF
uniref:Uncharacterized protein n=1 Tax=Panagrolaimus davidi TaxID=227884 RepID=A0A914P4K9_9BILA